MLTLLVICLGILTPGVLNKASESYNGKLEMHREDAPVKNQQDMACLHHDQHRIHPRRLRGEIYNDEE